MCVIAPRSSQVLKVTSVTGSRKLEMWMTIRIFQVHVIIYLKTRALIVWALCQLRRVVRSASSSGKQSLWISTNWLISHSGWGRYSDSNPFSFCPLGIQLRSSYTSHRFLPVVPNLCPIEVRLRWTVCLWCRRLLRPFTCMFSDVHSGVIRTASLAGCPVGCWLVHSGPFLFFKPTFGSPAHQSRACNHRTAILPMMRLNSLAVRLVSVQRPRSTSGSKTTFEGPRLDGVSLYLLVFAWWYWCYWFQELWVLFVYFGLLEQVARVFFPVFIDSSRSFEEFLLVMLVYWVNSTVCSFLVVVLPRSFVFRTIKSILIFYTAWSPEGLSHVTTSPSYQPEPVIITVYKNAKHKTRWIYSILF